MAVIRQKVMVGQLSLGMYVSELDRSWLETPFKLQGFLLKNQEQLIELSSLCQFVYVDIEKGIQPPAIAEHAYVAPLKGKTATHSVSPAIYSFAHYHKIPDKYPKNSDFYKTAKAVSAVHNNAYSALKSVDQHLSRGEVFDQVPLNRAAKDIVDCIINNPDVMSWLGRIHEADDFTHDHSVRSATWACVFACFLGLSRPEMIVLVQSVLLKDVGKTRLPKHLICKNEVDLNHDEQLLYRKYVSLSVALLKQVSGLDPKILSVIQAHREYYDGTGFPLGLKGDEIPLLSIITALSSEYDLLVNARDESLQLSPSDAMRKLHTIKNVCFQEDLVQDFNQALGVFPAGSVVELNTGELAVVIEQNSSRKLRPIISIMTAPNLLPLKKPKLLDLLTEARAPAHEGVASGGAGLPELFIVRDISTYECPLDLLSLKRRLFNGKRSVFSLLTGH